MKKDLGDQQPWFSSYWEGTPREIDLSKDTSLIDMCMEVFEKYRYKKAYTCMGADLLYDDIDTLSDVFGAYV